MKKILLLTALIISISGCETLQQQWQNIKPSLQRSPQATANNQSSNSASKSSASKSDSNLVESRLTALNATDKRLFDQIYDLRLQLSNNSSTPVEASQVFYHMWLGGREFVKGIKDIPINIPANGSQNISLKVYSNMLEWAEDLKNIKRTGADEYEYLVHLKLSKQDKLFQIKKSIVVKGLLTMTATVKGLSASNIR